MDGGQHIEPDGTDAGYLRVGTPEFRRARISLFAAGFSTFATLYCVQPLMPAFAETFAVSPAESSLALSLSTGALAFAMLVAGALSDIWGRKPVMLASLLASGVLGLLAAAAPDWHWLLAVRALEGVALSGLPAVAMAYVSEEVDPKAAGLTMGLYIGGTALGGMSGRVLTAAVADLADWRAAMAAIGVLGLVAAAVLWAGLPASRRFVRRPPGMAELAAGWRAHLGDPGLLGLFALAFLLMGGFVTVYNYTGFRLAAPPFDLRPAVVGAIFLVYLAGVVSSPWFGGLAGRHGQGRVLLAAVALTVVGLLAMAPPSVVAVVAGLALFTFSFFGAHAIASGWIGQRARTARAQASALYLFSYYMGSTVAGYAGGLFWSAWGWTGVAGFVGALLLAAVGIAALLMRQRT
ncbi:MFS transporter [Azospirillum sp. A39]|uniref:MFS transporter n=1 Tax=Azospirillum sp. A39 TaxID=3462279 RepID=UPI0040460017